MSIGLKYTESIELVKPVLDEYGSEKIGTITTVNCLFINRTGTSHGANQDSIISDASLYIDVDDSYVIENHNRLEEFLVKANRFGISDEDAWYKITNVSIGMDKLLDNKIDNIKLSLKKTVGIQYVS